MKKLSISRATRVFVTAVFLLGGGIIGGRASDHADPMSLNVLEIQKNPQANITDLHAFVVDHNGRRIVDPGQIAQGERLIISLCATRALLPEKEGGLMLAGDQFVLHLALDPEIRFFDESKNREGEDYQKALALATMAVDAGTQAVAAIEEKAKTQITDPAELTNAKTTLQNAVAARATLVNAHETDRSMQALYGGIFPHPDNIAEEATVEFELGLDKSGAAPQAIVTKQRFTGIPGKVNVIEKGAHAPATKDFHPGEIYVQAGIFDDPFIFPRFFRKNVVGLVISIPLSQLPEKTVHGAMLLWATTHNNGVQIDHVGRSLRTQLPRFGYLNTLHPRDHVKAITQVHAMPGVMDNFLATFLSPLEAHRHYDSVPDVMVYDLTKPAKFPNGRALEDDVSATLAAAGETLLLELSYAESRQFPRATTNDKQFLLDFPYLAPRWTDAEIAAFSQTGLTVPAVESADPAIAKATGKTKLFVVPAGPDTSAISAPNLLDTTWRTLWRIEFIAIVVLALLLGFTVRSVLARIIVGILTICALYQLQFVYTANTAKEPTQPAMKLWHLIYGGGEIALLAAAWLVVLGRRSGEKWPHDSTIYPKGRQELTSGDLEGPSSYLQIQNALFNKEANEQYYGVWGAAGEKSLPLYQQTVASIAAGLFRFWKDFAMLSAAKRTLRSHADLRWDRKGFRRLVHPIGICLEGAWHIDDADTGYSGYFAAGKNGRVIARYSLGGNEPRNGHYRSLGLVGKIFPLEDEKEPGKTTPRAHFITQEDLGGALTHSIKAVDLTNSPPVTLWRRGLGLPAFLFVIVALMKADDEPSERQLYEVAELEKPETEATKCPRFMRLKYAGAKPGEAADGVDFREEILGIIYNAGDADQKRELVFDIEVSDTGDRSGTFREKVSVEGWRRIGTLSFTKAVASRNGDFVVHFHHPVWRTDRNDKNSVARDELKPAS